MTVSIEAVEALIREMERRIVQIERQLAVEEVHRMNVETRLKAIEETLKWLVRLILGAIVMAGMAYGLQGGFRIG